MSPPTVIYAIRHGRTPLNAEGRFRGRLDPPLDEEGLREAQLAGRRLLVSAPAHVYSSPLRRARQTAEAIGRVAGAPLTTDEDLVDLDYGAWAGLSAEKAERRDPDGFAIYRADPEQAIPPDGEPLSAVADRVLKALLRIGEAHPGRTVAAVSHEVPIRLVVARLAGLRGADLWDLLVPTGSVVGVTVADGRFELTHPRPGTRVPPVEGRQASRAREAQPVRLDRSRGPRRKSWMAGRYWMGAMIALGLLWAAVRLGRTRAMFGQVAGLTLLVFALSAIQILWLGGRRGPDGDADDPVDPPNGSNR